MLSKIDSVKRSSYGIQERPEIASGGNIHTTIVPIVASTGQHYIVIISAQCYVDAPPRDAKVYEQYAQMKRKALQKLNRKANEDLPGSVREKVN